MEQDKFIGHYIEWREKRINAIIKHYTIDFFKDKSIVELGAGHGDVGNYFNGIGANVVCIEGRQDNVSYIKNNFKNIKTIKKDFDIESLDIEYVDIIINMGVLYHLKNPSKLLIETCMLCNYIILETEVVDSRNISDITYIDENQKEYDQSLHGVGARMSVGMIEHILNTYNFKFKRIKDNSCNSGPHVYDWKEKNNGHWESGQRALWFCEKIRKE